MNQDNHRDPHMNDPYYAPREGDPDRYWQGEEPDQGYGAPDEVPFQPVQDPRMQQQPPNWQEDGGYPQQAYPGQNPQYGGQQPPYGGQPPRQAYGGPTPQSPQAPYGHPQYQPYPPRGGRQGQRPPRRPMGNPLLMTQTINDFKELFKGYVSAQPLNAFKFDLSSLTWPVLLIANILIYALTKASAVYMSYKEGLLGTITEKPPWGMPFLFGIIEQLLVLGIIVGMGFLTAYVTRSDQRPPLQFVKTLAVATIPHTVMHFIFLFLGIGLPRLILFLSIMAVFFLIFTYYNGYNKLHPAKRSSYWWFLLSFLLVAIVLYLMPYSLPRITLI